MRKNRIKLWVPKSIIHQKHEAYKYVLRRPRDGERPDSDWIEAELHVEDSVHLRFSRLEEILEDLPIDGATLKEIKERIFR